MKTMKTAARRAALAAAALAVLASAPAVASAQTLVTLDDGGVQGHLNDGTREFLGIPYAAPPVGSLRFAPPAAPTPWGTTLDASVYPPGCSQLPTLTNSDTRIENEDCLYLNVWTPETMPADPLPVMVWFHGGSNTSGSISDFVPFPGYETSRLYDGHTLSKVGNVIVVTVNYRLNVFGFFGLTELAGEDPAYPYSGNQGLLDQRRALQWVRDNIAQFGGNPANVTIFGESAGAFDVCAHVVSPLSRGLFHKAISQSGGCSVGVATKEDSAAAAQIIANELGCGTGTASEKLACLRAVPTADLLDAGPLVSLVAEGTNLALSVDGGFLPEHPRDTLDSGDLPKIPWILGANSDEGTLFSIGAAELTESEYSAELLARYGSLASQVEALYPATRFGTPLDTLIRVDGDATLVCSTYDVAKRFTAQGRKAFTYNFNRVPPLLFIAALDLGAFHGLELGYVFGSAGAPTVMDAKLSTHVQNYWTSFATKSKPRSEFGVKWPKFKSKTWRVVRLDAPLSEVPGWRKSECDFWSSVYDSGNF